MKNDELYKKIAISSLGISSRIKQLADEKNIESLYELIQFLNSLNTCIDLGLKEDEEDDYPDGIIILNDEKGNEVKFEFLDLIEYKGEEYVVLLPLSEEEDNNEGEVVILQLMYEDDDDVEEYSSVDSEETLKNVFSIFKEKFKDEFNFV